MKNRDENFCLGTSAFDEGLGSSPSQLRSIGETMAEVDKARKAIIENRMHRLTVAGMFEGTTRIPSYPSPRFLEEEKKAEFDKSLALDRRLLLDVRAGLINDCGRWKLMFKPRGGVGAASPLFARVPDYNNELLLLL